MRRQLIALIAFASVAVAQQPAPPKAQPVVMKGKAPVAENVLRVKLPRPREGTLPNGLHLIVLEDHRAPLVSMSMLIPGAGGFFDAPASLGVAGVTAAMMREGTASRTTTQISEQLETMAANLTVGSGASSLDATFNASALTANVDKVFELTADLLLRPTFPADELTKYRQRTLAGLNQQRSNPGFLAQELWSKIINGDHPAGRVAMSPADLNKVTRDQLVEWHRTKYVPDHAVMAIAGDISFADAEKLVKKHFGEWKKSGTPKPKANDPGAPPPARVYLVDRPNSVQTNFIVGAQAIERTNPDYDALQLMNAVVGAGPTGRLFTHLREEKGYTYGAFSGMTAGRFKGTWLAQTDVRSEVTEPALTDLMDELRQIRDVTVPAKELADKKRSLVASFALSLESPPAVLNYYITRWLYNLPADYWDKYPERVMAVNAAQVQAMAKKYLDPKNVQIIAVGDGKKVEETLRKFGTLEVYNTEGQKRIVP
jgi:zinc protease